MNGSHYVCGERGIAKLVEALRHLQLSDFFDQAEIDI